ncbi:Gfo/Idh/MocA family oxidoreductase [Microbacterium sp. NPDC076911]|uniref:Gfo/Idh/MocA family protein n=1 Tax=Microbacterium sp. NPDC076911 TaxID=3154958 RepID=UPI00342B070F
MKLAVVGAGKIVEEFLPHASAVEGLALAAIYGRPARRQHLEQLQAQFGIERVYVDYDEMLDDPQIDTVWIAVPNSLHMEFARRALLADKHVICEKPFVLSESDLAELRRIATAKGVILVEAISTLDLANYRWIQEHIDDLGDLRLIQCDYSQYSSRFEAFQAGNVLPAFDPAKGGGALMDIGIYTIHFVVGLLGQPRAVSYTANIERGIDTSGILVLDYETCTAVCVCAKDSDGPIRAKLQGTHGSFVVDGAPNVMGSVDVQLRGGDTDHIAPSAPPHRMVPEFRAFQRMIETLDFTERDLRLDHSQAVLAVAARALASAGIHLGS